MINTHNFVCWCCFFLHYHEVSLNVVGFFIPTTSLLRYRLAHGSRWGFFGGCPLLKFWQHFTTVNKITAYALTLISSVTASSKPIPSVTAFLTKSLQSKKPKEIHKPYNRESSHTLPLTFSEFKIV